MDTAYYKCNVPIYEKMLEEKTIKMLPFWYVIIELRKAIQNYDVSVITAYNLMFDNHAFWDTYHYIETKKFKPRDEHGNVIKSNNSTNGFTKFCQQFMINNILKKEVEFLCIYKDVVTPKLLATEDYVQIALQKKWLSEKDNILTSAECAYRYLKKDYSFIEKHTALEDVRIEAELLKACKDLPIVYDGKTGSPYQAVKKVREEFFPDSFRTF